MDALLDGLGAAFGSDVAKVLYGGAAALTGSVIVHRLNDRRQTRVALFQEILPALEATLANSTGLPSFEAMNKHSQDIRRHAWLLSRKEFVLALDIAAYERDRFAVAGGGGGHMEELALREQIEEAASELETILGNKLLPFWRRRR